MKISVLVLGQLLVTEQMLDLVQHLLIVAHKTKSVSKLYCTVYEYIHVDWEQAEQVLLELRYSSTGTRGTATYAK